MYLKSIELQGFKSFPNRTKLTFEQGSTVIVGPNGSGKSNLSDAMRWVLGEISSKALRGSKMEDIIFGGSDSRKPMTYAEVTVSFDNRGEGRLDVPYDEISVTRRYHRNGDSEYFINRSECRLRDIYEMFLNTGIGRDGYSIIGQGKIAELVSKNSDDRREIFEDAAGIAKYRHRKNESERKLEATTLNMDRVKDSLTVMSGHLASLQRESIRARRFVEYSEIKKQADVRLWLYDTEKLRRDIAASESSGGKTDRELADIQEETQTLEHQQTRLEELSSESRRNASELMDRIKEMTGRNYALDSEIKVARTKIENFENSIKNAEADAKSFRAQADGEKQNSAAKLAEADRLCAEVERLKKEEADLRAAAEKAGAKAESLEDAIAAAFDEISACRAEISDAEARLELLGRSDSENGGRDEAARAELDEREKTAREHEDEYRRCEESIEKFEKKILVLKATLESRRSREAQMLADQQNRSRELSALTVRADTLRGQIEALRRMEEHFEGYNNSVKHVMNEISAGRLQSPGKIYGPVSSLIHVESKYVTAVEIALGAAIQNIVVQNEETARAAINCLRRDNAGRATFFPLTSVKPVSPTKEIKDAQNFSGYVAVASELAVCKPEFAPVISSMLGRTVVFDNLENATVMAKACAYNIRIVTLDGQQINSNGSFTGGSVRTGSGILTRADEIKRMEEELVASGRKSEKLEEEIKKAQQELEKLGREIETDDGEKQFCEKYSAVEKAKLEKQKETLEQDRQLLEKFRSDLEESEDEKEKRAAEIEALEIRRKELSEKVSELEAYRIDADANRGDALNDRDSKINSANGDAIKISGFERDIENCRALSDMALEKSAQLLQTAAEKDARVSILKEDIGDLKAGLEESIKALSGGNVELEKFNESRTKSENQALEYEQKLVNLRRTLSDRQSRLNQLMQEKLGSETQLAGLRSQLDAMSSKFWEEHEMTRDEALACNYPALTPEERPSVLETQTEYRNKIRNIGSCDPASIEEYEKLKVEYDSKQEQLADLEKSKEEIEKAIRTLEEQMKQAFVTAFDAINENFKKTFTELFGGGSAELILTDPENVLESGIEIKAAPPGKIVKSILQLSGGEQSFTAIALLFSILQVNPTPFCILDEIEAALDEVNVERFAQYIRRYSDDTQFILITHRRGTMNAADRLYGVTMPESGISRVLEVNVNEIAEKKGELWNELS